MSTTEARAHVCTAPRIQSAHACNSKHPLHGFPFMSALSRCDIWILIAAENRASAEVLRAHWSKRKNSKVSDAILDGEFALTECARADEDKAIQYGALLHIGVQAAVQKARELHELRAKRRQEVTC